jgi:hypothetical protein
MDGWPTKTECARVFDSVRRIQETRFGPNEWQLVELGYPTQTVCMVSTWSLLIVRA